jgi:hypothetical protein
MPQSWTTARNGYNYPVRLSDYKRAGEFPGFSTREIPGDRASTIEFEDYFRANSDKHIEPYFEVVFWKMYSREGLRDQTTSRIVDHVLARGVQPSQLRQAVDRFMQASSKSTLDLLRAWLGIKMQVLPIALTFPAFVDPDRYPMIDTQTARWITANYRRHSHNTSSKLTPFELRSTSVRYEDFDNYLNWVEWYREMAETLFDRTGKEWRARDVEMAVFTAAREGLPVNALA